MRKGYIGMVGVNESLQAIGSAAVKRRMRLRTPMDSDIRGQ